MNRRRFKIGDIVKSDHCDDCCNWKITTVDPRFNKTHFYGKVTNGAFRGDPMAGWAQHLLLVRHSRAKKRGK